MSDGEWRLIDGPAPDVMNWELIAGGKIFRPRLISEMRIRNRAEAHLRTKYEPGTYSDSKTINEVIQHQFGFYSSMLTPALEKTASLHFMEFVLHQYDLSASIERSVRSLDRDHPDRNRWSELGPTVRRMLKYLAERIALLAPEEAPKASKAELLDALDEAVICAEEIVRLYSLSEQTHSIYPDDTRLVIGPPGELDYFDLTISKREVLQFSERVRADTANRDKYIPENRFLFDIDQHDAILGNGVRDRIGISYKEAMQAVAELNRGASPHPGGFPIPFVHRENAAEVLAKGLGFSKGSVMAALDGLSLNKTNMMGENRVVWKPKQEYRAYRRAFFEFPHPLGPHLIWSKRMFEESFGRLASDVVSQKFPPEWTSPEVLKGIARISNMAGKWFESICANGLRKLGFQGTRSFKDALGTGDQRLMIPAEIGELDCLGYSPTQELLMLGECKLIRPGSEPAFFRDDMSKFVTSSGSYADQLRRKAGWVRANLGGVCSALESVSDFPSTVKPKRFVWVMITYHSSVVSYAISDFPCISFAELMMAHEKKGAWPFDMGIVDCLVPA